MIGPSKAKELIFTGDRLSAGQAKELGLVNHVCDDFAKSLEKAFEIAHKIGEKGPIAIKAAKRAVHYGVDLDIEAGLKLEDECYKLTLSSEDRLEGLKAFAEKRKPVYVGK